VGGKWAGAGLKVGRRVGSELRSKLGYE